MSASEDYVALLGPQIESTLREKFKEKWNTMPLQAKKLAAAAVADMLRLGLEQARGIDVQDEIAFCTASIANVASFVTDMTAEAVKETLIEAASFLGLALGKFVGGAIKGAVGL